VSRVITALTGLVGLAVWAWGLSMFIDGNLGIGGAVMLGGGIFIVVALGGGWGHFWEGLANWLHFR